MPQNIEDMELSEEFESKFGCKYSLLYSPTQSLWKIFINPNTDNMMCIARFNLLADAKECAEILKRSV